jgi:hypothetical protein
MSEYRMCSMVIGPQLKTLHKPNSHDCTLALILESGWMHTSLSMSGFRDKQRTLVNTVDVPGDAGSSPAKSQLQYWYHNDAKANIEQTYTKQCIELINSYFERRHLFIQGPWSYSYLIMRLESVWPSNELLWLMVSVRSWNTFPVSYSMSCCKA